MERQTIIPRFSFQKSGRLHLNDSICCEAGLVLALLSPQTTHDLAYLDKSVSFCTEYDLGCRVKE